MTAIIGVMNKQAIAIAADSAVTIQNSIGRKVQNHANKIFTLSKYHPVGAMIYNSASFMDVPWEVIINMYREELKDRSFPNLQDYATDFFEFLKKKEYFTSGEIQLKNLNNALRSIFDEIAKKALTANGGIDEARLDQYINCFKREVDSFVSECSNMDVIDSLKDYTEIQFKEYTKEFFDSLTKDVSNIFGDGRYDKFREDFESLSYIALRCKNLQLSYTGIVFVGYGNDNIYPGMIAYNIYLVFDNTLRFYLDDQKEDYITFENTASVISFAQTDVIETIISGIDPRLEYLFNENFKNIITKYNKLIENLVRPENIQLADGISKIDIEEVVLELINSNNEVKSKQYIIPLVNTIETLSKEDLVEVAESLISLTSLKRRMTFAEESVGGPVDVAVISKGDGFIWIKRKNYFPQELNHSFFSKYFKS